MVLGVIYNLDINNLMFWAFSSNHITSFGRPGAEDLG